MCLNWEQIDGGETMGSDRSCLFRRFCPISVETIWNNAQLQVTGMFCFQFGKTRIKAIFNEVNFYGQSLQKIFQLTSSNIMLFYHAQYYIVYSYEYNITNSMELSTPREIPSCLDTR
jgi:hypothetical protein